MHRARAAVRTDLPDRGSGRFGSLPAPRFVFRILTRHFRAEYGCKPAFASRPHARLRTLCSAASDLPLARIPCKPRPETAVATLSRVQKPFALLSSHVWRDYIVLRWLQEGRVTVGREFSLRRTRAKTAAQQRKVQPTASHDCNCEHPLEIYVSRDTCTFGERRQLG